MILIVSWAIENNLVFLGDIPVLVIDCDSFLVIFTGWLVIVIVSWAIGNNLIYLRCYSGWTYVCDSILGY